MWGPVETPARMGSAMATASFEVQVRLLRAKPTASAEPSLVGLLTTLTARVEALGARLGLVAAPGIGCCRGHRYLVTVLRLETKRPSKGLAGLDSAR